MIVSKGPCLAGCERVQRNNPHNTTTAVGLEAFCYIPTQLRYGCPLRGRQTSTKNAPNFPRARQKMRYTTMSMSCARERTRSVQLSAEPTLFAANGAASLVVSIEGCMIAVSLANTRFRFLGYST